MSPQIIGLGVDLVDLGHFCEVFQRHRPRFLALVFGEDEWAMRNHDEAAYFAELFAAKEAVLKVLGTGWGRGISWLQVRIRAGSSGPMVRLRGSASLRARRLGIRCINLCTGQTRETAFAVAIGLT